MKLFKLGSRGITHIIVPLIVIIGVVGVGTYVMVESRADTVNTGVISSGWAGMCLDDWHDGTGKDHKVDIFKCNQGAAQSWQYNTTAETIAIDKDYCIGVNVPAGDTTIANPAVELFSCRTTTSGLKKSYQQWKVEGSTLVNVHTNMCMTAPGTTQPASGTAIELASCSNGLPRCTPTAGKACPEDDTMITAVSKGQIWHMPTATKTGSGTTTTGSGSTTTGTGTGSSTTGSGTTTTPPPTSKVSCDYQVDTWSGDASSVGYSVDKLSSTNGNPASYSVKIDANKGTTEVVGYPSVQCLLYSAMPSTLTSSFNITPPAASSGLDYEYAYDIWLDTAANAEKPDWSGQFELMIWNYVNGQVPAGSEKGTLSDGSKVYVRGTDTAGTVSVVLPQNETKGTVDIASIVSQLKAKGYISSIENGILDVEYGIEAPYGGGQTFTVNSLSVAE